MKRAWLAVFIAGVIMGASVSIVAEKEIKRYEDNNYLWFKNVCNLDLRPNQLLWQEQLDRSPRTVTVAPPRTGKTYGVEMHGLKANACNPWEDYRIFAPAKYQSLLAYKYHTDAIERSPVLSAFINVSMGRRQFGRTSYTFANASNAECFGQDSKLDGVNATILRLEEFDDMDQEIVKDRILPRGMAVNRNGLPTRVRITGVIQGKENLYNYEHDKNFDATEKIDIYDAMALGIIDRDYVSVLRDSLTDDQWLRIALVRYVESRNFFWSTHLRAMQKSGQKCNIDLIIPQAGSTYDAEGTVGLGLDMSGQGESETSSKYTLQVVERLGMFKRWLYGEEFEPTMDPTKLRKRVVAIWDYFRPKGGFADAFDSNLIAQINDDLYDDGLIGYDRRREHAENSSANWKHWTLQPIRFQGSVKHMMFKGLQNDIHQRMFYSPMVIRGDERYAVLDRTIRQLENIRSKKGGAQYLLYEMIKKSVGDDHVDALAMCNYFLDAGKDRTVIVDGTGSGQSMAGLTAGGGTFLT